MDITIGEEEDEGAWANRIRVADLKPGQELNGIVNSVTSFGCFVDVGADQDGLVHVSRIKSGFIRDVASVVQPGQAVKVWVTEISPEGKLNLSMVKEPSRVRRGASEEEISALQGVSPEEWLSGTVESINDFGAFISVSPPGGGPVVMGMLHIAQIKDGFVEHPAEELQVGQQVRVRVLEARAGKIKLSMRKSVAPSPVAKREDFVLFEDVSPDEWLEGKVHHTAPFGVFVEVPAPGGTNMVIGMVHASEIRDGFVDDPAAEVKVGQVVKVRVKGVDPQAGRLTLSMMQPRDGP